MRFKFCLACGKGALHTVAMVGRALHRRASGTPAQILALPVCSAPQGCRRTFTRFAFCLLPILWPGFCGAGSPSDENRPTRTEYEVKAAFLLKLPSFVNWPTNAFVSADAPLVIGILGKDPFGSVIDELARAARPRGRPVMVCRLRTVKEAIDKNCHVLFVASSEKESVQKIVAGIGNKPILTAGDIPGLAMRGIMINFVVTNKTVKFEINEKRARDAGLRISSQLLDLAVGGTKPRPF